MSKFLYSTIKVHTAANFLLYRSISLRRLSLASVLYYRRAANGDHASKQPERREWPSPPAPPKLQLVASLPTRRDCTILIHSYESPCVCAEAALASSRSAHWPREALSNKCRVSRIISDTSGHNQFRETDNWPRGQKRIIAWAWPDNVAPGTADVSFIIIDGAEETSGGGGRASAWRRRGSPTGRNDLISSPL